MIRIIIVALFLFLFLLLGIPVLLIEQLIGMKNKKAKDYSMLRIVQYAFRAIIWVSGVDVTVIGEENIPDEPVLLRTVQEADRIHCQEGNAPLSPSPGLDESFVLHLPGPGECKRRPKIHSAGYRLYKIRCFHLHFSRGNP